MECDQCREALSARLDGEPEPGSAVQTDHHLAGCPGCREWQRRAGALTRRLRLRPVPELPAVRVELTAPVPTAGGGAGPWRIALAVVAVGQLALAVAQILGWHAGMLMSTPGPHDMGAHLFDESTAWNLALAVAMACVAWRAGTATGLILVVGGFLVALTVFCVRDLAAGEVTAARLAEHGLLVVGFSLMLTVRRKSAQPGGPAETALDGAGMPEAEPRPAAPADTEPDSGGPPRTRWLHPVDRHQAA
ncbi:membrane protein [Actinocatenispora thailandica]|uniref:Membrane protein n=1 Tax=Actinocatenispora thailandica TaxID=227318 RepID=A0A7R7DMA8_9ACTN|nr:zf-HC2 domain-containing protein [Actinocatenispora thailandica]BCJ34160.1 membrane protein [Actinocatenispora thailandica]